MEFFSSFSGSFYRFSAVFEAVILFITRRSIVFIAVTQMFYGAVRGYTQRMHRGVALENKAFFFSRAKVIFYFPILNLSVCCWLDDVR